MNKIFLIFSFLAIPYLLSAQNQQLDSILFRVERMELETKDINLRIAKSRNQLQTGILVSTIGYSITIAGGLMLGRERDELGQVLLVTGGATGATGTFLLFDSFNILAGRKKKGKRRR